MFYEGVGTQKNFSKCITHWNNVARSGYAIAQNNLGYCYYYGRANEQNNQKALKWWRRAAGQSYGNAENALGVAYFTGLVVNKNYEVAGEWFKKAAEHGDIEGKDNVSLLEGVEPEQLPTLAERLAFGFNYLSTKELEEFIKVYENQEKDDAVTDEAE